MTIDQPWGPPTAPSHTTIPAEPVLAELAPAQTSKRPMRRLLAGAGVVAVLAVGVGAFAASHSDDGGGRSTTAFALAKVADNTFAQGTARMTMSLQLPIAEVDGAEAIVEGFIDLDRGLASYTMDMATVLEASGGGVPNGDANVEVIQSGIVMYMRGAIFAEAPGVGDKWIKMDMANLSGSQGVDIGQLASPSGNNPSDQLGMLRGAGDATEVGNATIRGAETTHYRSTIDLEQVYRDRGAVTDDELFQEMLDGLGSTEIPVDVWVDDEGRARKQEMTMSVQGRDIHLVIELYDFGVKVDVAVPEDSDTVDFADLMGN